MALEPPTRGSRRPFRIGKYEVIRHIATGGMGAVYKARDTEENRDVALKVLPPDMARKKLQLERFNREARSAARLDHENIVAIYEFGEIEGTHFLALEFVDGIDLHEYISRKGKLDPREAREILTQAARALEHAHAQGIVHRDIKPSNFLIATRNGEPLVKLTDLGLARVTTGDEFRVTTDGTTIGTVDYMSPEQARDSGLADIRSDLYSLGCTFYHMLAGQAPFAEGSLTERIYKHVEEAPPDIRKFSPRVPDGLVEVLERLLEKKPAKRYQTPRQLLDDLASIDEDTGILNRRDTGADLPRGDVRAKSKAPKTPARIKRVEDDTAPVGKDTQDEQPVPGRKKKKSKRRRSREAGFDWSAWWLWAMGGVFLLLMAGMVWMNAVSDDEDEDQRPARPGPAKKGEQKADDDTNLKPIKPVKNPGQEDSKLPPLYQPRVPLNLALLRQDFQEPALPGPAANAHVVRVSRAPGQADTFPSLAEACKQTAADRETVIEVHDNGPLFESAAAVTGRNLVIRAGKGFRPLIAWDVGKEPCFLSVRQGNLTLEGLDVVSWKEWRDAGAGEAATLFQVKGGSVAARNCTFSTSGKHPLGVAVFRLLADEAGAPPRCLLSRCYTRGADQTALAVSAPGADVLIDRCLVAGGDRPLLQVAGRNKGATTLRLFRSTLVAGKTLLRIDPAGKEDTSPDVRVSAWDVLLAQGNRQVEGDMVVMAPGQDTAHMRWRAINCLYAGWTRLLTGKDVIRAADLEKWHRRWQYDEGDKAILTTWPRSAPLDPEESGQHLYRQMKTEAGFTATSGPGPLGCDVDDLLREWPSWPATRRSWLMLTFKRYPTSAPLLPDDDTPPDGEPIDLTKVNLADEVKERAGRLKPGSKLALRLSGSGNCVTGPIKLKGLHLVLFFEPPPKPMKGKAAPAPLVLVPDRESAAQETALIDVEDGSLEIVGGRIRCPDAELAKIPPYVLHLRNAGLRLFRSHLEGPLVHVPSTYRGLIHFEGSGKSDAEKTPACAVNESALLSGRRVIHLTGTGARVSLAQSLVLASGDAFHLDPGPDAQAPLTLQCLLEKNTVAMAQSFFRLSDAPRVASPPEPIIVQADNNLFVDPFTDVPHQARLLSCDGEALPRGLLLWQGKNNGYDLKRLHGYVYQGEGNPAQRQDHAVWARLWGSAGEQLPELLDLTKTTTTSLALKKKRQLEHLALPYYIRELRRGKPPLGANLAVLGIGKKK
jgi:serine/threonine-protein kinase